MPEEVAEEPQYQPIIGAEGQPQPDWINTLPRSDNYHFESGYAKLSNKANSIQRANAKAKEKISQWISTTVQSVIINNTSDFGSGENRQSIEAFESISRQVANNSLVGVTQEELWVDQDGGVWVMVSIPIENTLKDFEAAEESFKISSIPMTYVEGGSFQKGSSSGGSDESPVHDAVRVGSFYVGTSEVTQDIYEEVMGSNSNPSYRKGAQLPVEQVSWYEAVVFCNALSRREGRDDAYAINGQNVSCDWESNGYRLPTEAEWEYAARGGVKSRGYIYAGNNTVGDVSWYDGNSGRKTHDVGGKAANELGLYDMSGNVWEWCWDRYDDRYYRDAPADNPVGPSWGYPRVLRGGSWFGFEVYSRLTMRRSSSPEYVFSDIGFRVLLPAE